MGYDLTKSLGNALEDYMSSDIKDICMELVLHGIVYETQFQSLSTMVCKKNAFDLSQLFSRKTQLDIYYDYDNSFKVFVFFDTNRFSRNDAVEKSMQYHQRNM